MPPPTYLAKNRHGGFLFRIKIPADLCTLFSGKKVLTKSLATHHRPTALKLARVHAVRSDELFGKLRMKDKYLFDEQILKARLRCLNGELSDLAEQLSPRAYQRLISNKEICPEIEKLLLKTDGALEKEAMYRRALTTIESKISIARKLETERDQTDLRREVMRECGLGTPSAHTLLPQKQSAPLSVLWAKYRSHKISTGKWKETTPRQSSKLKEYDRAFQDFLDIIGGDRPATEYYEEDNDILVEGLLSYPANRSVKYPGISLREIPSNAEPIRQSTAAQKLDVIKPFFNFLQKRRIIDVNWLNEANIERDSQSRPTPTQQDLAEWFNLEEDLISSAWQFWIPRLALFHGFRQNEVSQLKTRDVAKDPRTGYWYISIAEGEDKSVKTDAGTRKIPIHQVLISNGFLDYHKKVMLAGHNDLWPNLPEKAGTKGQTVSRYWSQLRAKHNVLSQPKDSRGETKVFHSLRRVIVNNLTISKVPREVIAGIIGHEQGESATNIYLDDDSLLEQKKDALDKFIVNGVAWEHPKKMVFSFKV